MIKIKRASINEISDIVKLNSFVQKLHHAHHPDIFKPVSEKTDTQKLFEHIFQEESHLFYIAYIEELPVGYAWVAFENKREYPLKYGRKQAYIHQIAVHENYRHQKVGTALFEKIKDEARKEGINHFELDSWAFNTDAHKFFMKLGFETYNIKMWCNVRNAT